MTFETLESNLPIVAEAIESGHLALSDVVAWADRSVLGLDSPPSWLLDLCLARTQDQAVGTLWMARERVSPGSAEASEASRVTLHLGFLYLRHERGELSMAELLGLAGRYTDAHGYFDGTIDCESFYYLLNEIDGGGPTLPSDRPPAERVAALFAPMAERARECQQLLATVNPPDTPGRS